MDAVIIYSIGMVAMSVCAKKNLTPKFIEKEVNRMSPTGISTDWVMSKDKKFKSGHPNPCQCEEHTNRKHYLLNC